MLAPTCLVIRGTWGSLWQLAEWNSNSFMEMANVEHMEVATGRRILRCAVRGQELEPPGRDS